MHTFNNSDEFLAAMQKRYGSANFSQWQVLRKRFYSLVQYPVAGIAQLSFFGQAIGASGTTRQTTNMPKAGSFGQQHFLLKTISTSIFIPDRKLEVWAGTDATTLATEALNGFMQAGVLEFTVGSRIMAQIKEPFLQAPEAAGGFNAKGCGVIDYPVVEPLKKDNNRFLVDPNCYIEAEQNFEVTLKFPSGAIPITATTVVNDTTNPLYIGVAFDGLLVRPLQ